MVAVGSLVEGDSASSWGARKEWRWLEGMAERGDGEELGLSLSFN